jgi:hypothetical protein
MKTAFSVWRKRATVLLGTCLFVTPWAFWTSGHAASSANAWVVGVCLFVAALPAPIVSGPRTATMIRVGVGAWSLAAPFVLGFAGSRAAWNA